VCQSRTAVSKYILITSCPVVTMDADLGKSVAYIHEDLV
jgi:hypothetical protein